MNRSKCFYLSSQDVARTPDIKCSFPDASRRAHQVVERLEHEVVAIVADGFPTRRYGLVHTSKGEIGVLHRIERAQPEGRER